MRLVVISAAFPPFWAPEGAHAFALCQRLAKRGVEVELITSEGAMTDEACSFNLHPIMPDWRWQSLPRLLLAVHRLQPDAILLIYIGWIYKFHPMITLLPSVCRLLMPRTRFVCQFGNVQLMENRWVYLVRELMQNGGRSVRLLLRLAKSVIAWIGLDLHLGSLASHSHAIIMLSQHHLDLLLLRAPRVATKTRVIPVPPLLEVWEGPDGLQRAEGRAQLQLRTEDFALVFFGHVYRRKGLETLFQALYSLRAAERNLKLVIIGSSPFPDYERELRDLARELGLTDQLRWAGYCKSETGEVSRLLRAADLCVLPFDIGIQLSNSSFACAASHGLPIITTAQASLERAFVHGINVFLCPPKDPIALAHAIATLHDSPGDRARLGEGSKRLADDVFSWDRVLDVTLGVLNPTRRRCRTSPSRDDLPSGPENASP